jgi:hypothetical protein
MRPNRGWSLGLMPRTETPPPISDGRTWKASRWEHLSRSQQSRGQPMASRACALARARERKICISDKAGAQSRLLAEGSRLFIPPPVFARCRGSFLADWSLENAPFYPQKSPMSLKTKDSKKRKFLRFMEGNRQRRLLAGSSELSIPLPAFPLPGVFHALLAPRHWTWLDQLKKRSAGSSSGSSGSATFDRSAGVAPICAMHMRS